jgi:Histidine phosphatase superfamily (branch 2)
MYADFSHDNDLTSIFAALGLYNGTAMLPTDRVATPQEADGYSASVTVPFSSRAYFEKMVYGGAGEELVRVTVNDRVLPLANFGADGRGLVPLGKFVNQLSFAREWAECFL